MGNSNSVIIPQYGADFGSTCTPSGSAMNEGFSKIDSANSPVPSILSPNETVTTSISSSKGHQGASGYNAQNPQINEMTAIWSANSFAGGCIPSPRCGHAWAYSEEYDVCVVAYGFDDQKKTLNDFWLLNLKSNTWSGILISCVDQSTPPTPRAGTKGVLIGKKMYLFGGFANNHYIDDFHVVDIETGVLEHPKTTGGPPAPCSGFVMSKVKNNQIIIFGGFNGNLLNQLSILNLETFEWKTVQTVHQRNAPGYCSLNNLSELFIFGGSKTQGLMRIDLDQNQIDLVAGSGLLTPNGDITQPNLLQLDDRYVLVVGGEKKNRERESGKDHETTNCNDFMPIYMFDIVLKKWSIFHVCPDATTVNFSDGYIDKNGEFLLPISKDATMFYRKSTREIVATLGYPQYSPPCSFVFDCGIALSALHLQCDLLELIQQH